MFNPPQQFAPKLRLKIYGEALAHFIRTNNHKDHNWRDMTEGMCNSLEYARQLNNRAYRPLIKKFFPEYYSFKPSTGWKQNDNYWFTRYYKRNGYLKRVSILTALAEGKSHEQWKKEWRAAGNK